MMTPSRARALLPFALAALTLLWVPSRATAVEERGWLSVEVGSVFYDPEQALRDGPGFGVRAGGFATRWIGLEAMAYRATPDQEKPSTEGATYTHFGANLIVTPDRYRWVLPYAYAGVGSAKVERDVSPASGGGSISSSRSAIQMGAGVIVRIGERVGFRLDGRNVTFEQEGGPGRDIRVNNFQISGGLAAFWFGRPRDTDEDGVPNKRDRCPETPRGAVVDAGGCPLDTDQDKVYDGLDRCAGTPQGAVVDPAGCPVDSDKDGVPDGIDTCDSTATGVVVDATGCGVDSDKDGVFDGPDRCPETPAGARVDAGGCPLDADGDGVPDGIDIAPATPRGAAVNAGGSPIDPGPYGQQLLDGRMMTLRDLEFAPDTTRILTPSSVQLTEVGKARLDSIAAVLAQWPMLKFEIAAHTDNRAEAARRQPLTQLRARAVLQYVLGRVPSLNPKSFWFTGYGDAEPLESNQTESGRAENRRIEFKVVNPNEFAAERARREAFGTTPVPPAPGLEPKMPAVPEEPDRPREAAPEGAPSEPAPQEPPAPDGGTPKN